MLKSLSEIHKRCFAKGWSEESFKNMEYILEPEGFVAWENVIDECEIKTICVLPEFRKQGFAEKLMRELLNKVQAKKFFLEVSEKNVAAVRLYEKLGFKRFSKRKDYYGIGDDALMMVYEA